MNTLMMSKRFLAWTTLVLAVLLLIDHAGKWRFDNSRAVFQAHSYRWGIKKPAQNAGLATAGNFGPGKQKAPQLRGLMS